MKSKDGGPAFPFTKTQTEVIGGPSSFIAPETTYYYSGMSLRDWFAGMALQGALSADIGKLGLVKNDVNSRDRIVEIAFALADAMLAEREKEGE